MNRLTGDSDRSLLDSVADEQSATRPATTPMKPPASCSSTGWSCCTEQQRTVVEHRFGLHGKGRRTLEEVGELMGVTRERVRQVQLAALSRLREISRREGVVEMPFID